MKSLTLSLLSLSSLALFVGCQQGDGYKPDFAYGPNPQILPDESVMVLATAPAMFREVGAIKVDHRRLTKLSRKSEWESALKDAKKQAQYMGANAIVVPTLGHYQRSLTTEAYTGLENGYGAERTNDWLKNDDHLTVLAIQVP